TGASRSTVYKHVRRLTPHVASPQPESVSSNAAPPDPPASSLSQPVVAAQPPKIIEGSNQEIREETKSNLEPNEESYGSYGPYQRESHRPPLPVVDQQAITALILLFGSDMRRKGYTNFLDYFEQFVIPRFEE